MSILTNWLGKGRIPPQDKEAEKVVLGATMLDVGAWDRIDGVVRPEMFYDPRNQLIFEAIRSLAADGYPIDLVTVRDRLNKMGKLGMAGDVYYLTELTAKVASAANLEYHAKIVARKWLLRSLADLANRISDAAYNEAGDPFAILDEMNAEMDSLNASFDSEEDADASDLVESVVEDVEKAMAGNGVFVTLGFPEFADYAFVPGELIVVGGRPGMGKTAFALAVAKNIAKAGVKVLFSSLEMKDKELISRDLASSHGISGMRLRTGLGITGHLLVKMQEYAKNYLGITIPKMGLSTVDKLRRKTKALRKKKGMKPADPLFIVVDYIQLMSGEGASREERIADISRGLKLLAQDGCNIVMALSQLNREVEHQTEKRPGLSALRGSGSIEQDADVVMLLYRPEYYGIEVYDDGTSTKCIAEVDMAKCRVGRPGATIKLAFEHGRYDSLQSGGVYNNDPMTRSVLDNQPIKPSRMPYKDEDGPGFGNEWEEFERRANG